MVAIFFAAGFPAGFAVALGAAVLAGATVLVAGFDAVLATGLGAAALTARFAAVAFTALDFAAGFGLETAVAAFGLAVFDFDGALAMDSRTPRYLLATEATPAPVSIRDDSEL
ncbi:hypothetical protein [Brevundimonas sp.]|uniref:hypothetical protein n=1 Tax=Brevundimonas sp. TaxID=1871086 RepID=UPI00356960A7